jgi:hypothetical protein
LVFFTQISPEDIFSFVTKNINTSAGFYQEHVGYSPLGNILVCSLHLVAKQLKWLYYIVKAVLRRKYTMKVVCILFASLAYGQGSIAVGTVTGLPNSTVRIGVSLTGTPPAPVAGLQFTFTYPKSWGVSAGMDSLATASIGADKILYCAPTATVPVALTATMYSQICILAGINQNTITPGPIAGIFATLPANFSGTANVLVYGTLGASLAGDADALSGSPGKVIRATSTAPAPSAMGQRGGIVQSSNFQEITSFECDPKALKPREQTHCVVKFSKQFEIPVPVIVSSPQDKFITLPAGEVMGEIGSDEISFEVGIGPNPPHYVIIALQFVGTGQTTFGLVKVSY